MFREMFYNFIVDNNYDDDDDDIEVRRTIKIPRLYLYIIYIFPSD